MNNSTLKQLINIKRLDRSAAVATCYRARLFPMSVKDISRVLGKPDHIDGDGKVTLQWTMQVAGNIVTLYDYKGDRWHFGGHQDAATMAAIKYVAELLGEEVAS